MKIKKVKDVKSPCRGTRLSAGIDFYVPNCFTRQILDVGEGVNIPSGIHAKIPEGFALIEMNKSGVSVKRKLQVGACVIDEDYQGELHLHVINIGDAPIWIEPGEKLVQMLLIPISYAQIDEVETFDELYPDETERGTGGFGSTGTR